MKTFKRHLTVANVLSCIALFVALSASAVAATKLSTGQVKAVNIANEAVTSPKIKNLAVSNPKLGKESVTFGKIKNLAVINSKLGKESVTSSKIKKKAVTTAAIAPEAVNSAKISSQLWVQLVKNVSYVNSSSVTNTEANKTATAECPAGKEAVGGGIRLEGELASVATTGSYPFFTGGLHTGWTAIAHESGGGPFGDWSIVAFAVCAEL